MCPTVLVKSCEVTINDADNLKAFTDICNSVELGSPTTFRRDITSFFPDQHGSNTYTSQPQLNIYCWFQPIFKEKSWDHHSISFLCTVKSKESSKPPIISSCFEEKNMDDVWGGSRNASTPIAGWLRENHGQSIYPLVI